MHEVTTEELQHPIPFLGGAQGGRQGAFKFCLRITERQQTEDFLVARIRPDTHFDVGGFSRSRQVPVFQLDFQRHARNDGLLIGSQTDTDFGRFHELLSLR